MLPGKLFFRGNLIKAVTLDVTGTLLRHKYPIASTYAACAQWAKLKDPPNELEFGPAFKTAYKETLIRYPYFRHVCERGQTSNQWWKVMLKRAVEITGRAYSDEDFDRFFLRVYQHFGSPQGYVLLPDTLPFLNFISDKVSSVGIISNCPARTVEETLPMLGIHDHFKFFLCAESFGGQKPDFPIYGEALKRVRFWDALHRNGNGHGNGNEDDLIRPEEILHIGDDETADYAGARAAGFQACLLNRGSSNVQYNEWLVSPEFPGKSAKDLQEHTYADFAEIRSQMSHLP